MGLREVIITTVRHRSQQYWHIDGVVDAAEAAAIEAASTGGQREIIDAIERVIKRHEFICNFDDPCDTWAA